MRSIAAAIASTSPAGTRRPFSPSTTTSGIPPTAVAITGVPTASASSSVCGRFSQADVSSADVDGAEERDDVVARARRRGTARGRAMPSAAACRSSAGPLGPVPEDEELDVVDPRDGLERVAERLLRGEPPRRAEREPSDAERGARLLARRQRRQLGRRIRDDGDPVGVSPQPSAISRR